MFIDVFKIRFFRAQKYGATIERLFFLANKHQTLLRFVVVGTSGTLMDYSLFFVFTRFFGLSTLVANPISVEIAIIWNFTWNNIWTFSKREVPKPLWKKFVIFQFVSLGGLLLSQNTLLIFNRLLNIYDLLAKALTLPIVAMFNYLVNSRWTFRDKARGKSMWHVYIICIIILLLLYFLLIQRIY